MFPIIALLMPRTNPLPGEQHLTAVRREHRAIIALAFLCVLAGITFFLQPEKAAQSSVGRVLNGPTDEMWSCMYVLGGLGVMYGIWFDNHRVEIPGLWLISTALLVNLFAVVIVRGIVPSLPTIVPFPPAMWVMVGRAMDLRRADRIFQDVERLERAK